MEGLFPKGRGCGIVRIYCCTRSMKAGSRWLWFLLRPFKFVKAQASLGAREATEQSRILRLLPILFWKSPIEEDWLAIHRPPHPRPPPTRAEQVKDSWNTPPPNLTGSKTLRNGPPAYIREQNKINVPQKTKPIQSNQQPDKWASHARNAPLLAPKRASSRAQSTIHTTTINETKPSPSFLQRLLTVRPPLSNFPISSSSFYIIAHQPTFFLSFLD